MKRKIGVRDEKSIVNIPTLLNISRIILTFVVIYMIIIEAKVINIVILFAIAALTDFFDGKIARKYSLVNNFGRKADMVADRFLWVGTASAFIVVFGIREQLEIIHGVQILLIMIREIIAAPSALVAFFSGRGFPHARFIAKATTFIQAFSLPALILSVHYPQWIYLSLPLSIINGTIGTISGFCYIHDVQQMEKKNERIRRG